MSDAAKSMMTHDFSGPIHAAQEAAGFDFSYQSSDFFSYSYDAQKKYESRNCWTRACQEQECLTCGLCRDVRGTSTYTGKGLFSYLNGLTRDPPSTQATADDTTHVIVGGTGRFSSVPRPPPNWRGLDESTLDNGEKDGGSGFGAASTPPDLSLLKVVQLLLSKAAAASAARCLDES